MPDKYIFLIKNTDINKYMDIGGNYEGEKSFKAPSSFDTYKNAKNFINMFLEEEDKNKFEVVNIKLKEYVKLFLEGVDYGNDLKKNDINYIQTTLL